MDCQRCGGAVLTFELDGREAVVCEDCGYVGVAVEHRVERREGETWTEALARFRAERGDDPGEDPDGEEGERGEAEPAEDIDEESATEEGTVTCRVCGERYRTITASHLRTHGMTTGDYREEFGDDVPLTPDGTG